MNRMSLSLRALVFWLAAVVFLAALPAREAIALSVRAVVDRSEIDESESLMLTVTLTDGSGEIDVSPIRDFSVSQRGTSTSIQIVNGAMTREQHVSYLLTPLKSGTLQVPPLEVRSGGQTVQTEPIRIHVGKAESPAQKGGSGQDLYITASVSEARPFVGQEIVYTFQLVSAVQVMNARYQKPSFEGFTVKETGKQKDSRKVVNGREVAVTEVSYLLTPLKAGSVTIGPGVLSCDVQDPQARRRPGSPYGSLFDDPFFSRSMGATVTRTLRSESIPVTVRPLPEDPSGRFSGLVGSFQLKAVLDKAEVSAGDSVTLTVTVEGRGNIGDAAPPRPELPVSFKVYPDNPKEEASVSSSGTSGKKVFRFALIPVEAGEFAVQVLPYPVLDPKSGAYQSLTAPLLRLRVRPGAGGAVSPQAGEKSALPAAPAAPPPVPEPPGLPPVDIAALVRNWLIPALGILAGIAALAYGLPRLVRWGRSRMSRPKTPQEMMKRRAEDALGEFDHSGGGSSDSKLALLYRALVSAVFGAAGRLGESLTYEEARTLLLEVGQPTGVVEEVVDLLSRVDTLRYGGASPDAETLKVLRDRTAECVRLLLPK